MYSVVLEDFSDPSPLPLGDSLTAPPGASLTAPPGASLTAPPGASLTAPPGASLTAPPDESPPAPPPPDASPNSPPAPPQPPLPAPSPPALSPPAVDTKAPLAAESPNSSSWTDHRSSGKGGSTLTVVGVAVGLGLLIVVALAVIVHFWVKKKRNDGGMLTGYPTLQRSAVVKFSFKELARSTQNFSKSNFLGEGGFGHVYKGVLTDGTQVAIKRLKRGRGDTEDVQGDAEFLAEVNTISSAQHPHLVELRGVCISGKNRCLVYEYLPNKTLEFHLHGVGASPSKSPMEQSMAPLTWSKRLKIAIGVAKGLANLHEEHTPRIIHRDIKASNILLDNDFEAKLGDFGLAKFLHVYDTSVATRVMGTFGYLDPDYASTQQLTMKSDVYSFGIVLLELITGKRPQETAYWAVPLLNNVVENEDVDKLVDKKLVDYNYKEVLHMVICASACILLSAKQRPLMSEIVRALYGDQLICDEFKKKLYESSNICETPRECRSLVLGSQSSTFDYISTETDA